MRVIFLPACLLVIGGCTTSRPPHAEISCPAGNGLILAGGFVADPGSADDPQIADIQICNGRITAVAPRLPASATRRLDIAGRYVIPGLWDMHAHVATAGSPSDALADYVAHGVLAIRDMGGIADSVFAAKRDVEQGRRLGPTMFVAGPTLNGDKSADFHLLVRDSAEAAAIVRTLRTRGADFIKIHRQTSRGAFRGIRQQTRDERIFFGGHVPLSMGWTEASENGMRTMEHIQTIVENELERGVEPVKATFDALARLEGTQGDEIFAAMSRNKSYWTPTLIYYESSWRSDSPQRRELKQRAYERMRPLVLRAFNAGVPILAGTDLLENRGQGLLDELQRLVRAGLTPRAALAAATTNAREVTGRGPGRIRTGEEGSLVVLRADPFADIANIRHMEAIVLRGQLLEAAALPRTGRSP